MKNLAAYFAIALWAYVIGAGCALQYQDEQRFATLNQHTACSLAEESSLTLEQELKLDAERLQAIDPVAAQIVLDTLQNVQQAKEVDLGNMYFTANDTLGHLSR